MKPVKKNILDFTYSELEVALKILSQPSFRAQQLCDWFYKKLIFDYDRMVNVSQKFKDILEKEFSLYIPQIHHIAFSKADNSYKFLLQTSDNKFIEAILMLDKGRSTVCVSCMIGCPLACKFCATGSQIGFVRKLTPAEIVGQVLVLLRYAQDNDHVQRITNVVFMGMGEPFLNLEAVEKSINILTHPKCFALSSAKISVSTAGVGPGIAQFVHKNQTRIAVSLHFPTDQLRLEYMPVNKRFPLKDLIEELKKVKLKKRDYILIEYIMLGGINDSLAHAKQLLSLIGNLKVKVNLIPFNPTKTLSAQASPEEVLNNFAKYLQNKGIFTSIRRSKGVDVDGGCGQFSLKKQ